MKDLCLSPIPPPPATRRLEAHQGPLVWIDCEMTGLDLTKDRLLEVACLITDGDLNLLDEGVNYVIRTDKKHLDSMNQWCVDQHGSSGLTAQCQNPEVARDHADVRASLLAYVRDRIPTKNCAVLAGNTVHADKGFLAKEMPELIEHLHYRIVDVSTIKELVRRWYGSEAVWTGGKGAHRALDDIKGSIEELKTYRRQFFLGQNQLP
ncbi:ribonuclease H-like protein [Violaceomyces palustris]|uniref:Ribonuclease H-like protein n=1 Tax=Violaceomyces palustris TaxID=1673888 RepID=A0ACD0NYY2_9BASI|nr:ribonuclease H-like protein [Violaceomyces palustris]